jgi:acyl-CoA thioester hydrolase
MFVTHIHPRFCDTDAMGHIGNTVIPVWLLEGREQLLALFAPDMDFSERGLVLVRTEIDFLGELRFGADVEVFTSLAALGNSSLTVQQEIHQHGVRRVQARSVMVHFDARSRRALPIPDTLRPELEKHLVD